MKLQSLRHVLFAWVIIAWGLPLISLLTLLGIVRVQGREHLQRAMRENRGTLIIHRHPGMKEVIAIPLLALSWRSFFHPFQEVPWVTPDRHNYYDPWWCIWFRPFAIPVDRENSQAGGLVLRKIQEKLKAGNKIIIAPEGGRTFKGTEFKQWTAKGSWVFSRPPEGVNLEEPLIRRFQKGIGLVAKGATIVPVWTETGRFRTSLRVGFPVNIASSLDSHRTRDMLEDIVLSLARPDPSSPT